MFRGVRRGQWVPVYGAGSARVVAPQSHRLGLPTVSRRWTGDGGALPDGSGFNSPEADVVLRKDARRVFLDWRAEPDPRRAAPPYWCSPR